MHEQRSHHTLLPLKSSSVYLTASIFTVSFVHLCKLRESYVLFYNDIHIDQNQHSTQQPPILLASCTSFSATSYYPRLQYTSCFSPSQSLKGRTCVLLSFFVVSTVLEAFLGWNASARKENLLTKSKDRSKRRIRTKKCRSLKKIYAKVFQSVKCLHYISDGGFTAAFHGAVRRPLHFQILHSCLYIYILLFVFCILK